MRVDVPRPLDLTLPTVGDDVVQLYAPLSVGVDIARPMLVMMCRQVMLM